MPFGALAGERDAKAELQPTKGVHVIVAGAPFAEGGEPKSGRRFHTAASARRRVFFVLPWQGQTLLGTTDTFCVEAADALKVTPPRNSILWTATTISSGRRWFGPTFVAGSPDCGPSCVPGPTIRPPVTHEFRIIDGPGPLLSVAGGKWTTYRHMADHH